MKSHSKKHSFDFAFVLGMANGAYVINVIAWVYGIWLAGPQSNRWKHIRAYWDEILRLSAASTSEKEAERRGTLLLSTPVSLKQHRRTASSAWRVFLQQLPQGSGDFLRIMVCDV